MPHEGEAVEVEAEGVGDGVGPGHGGGEGGVGAGVGPAGAGQGTAGRLEFHPVAVGDGVAAGAYVGHGPTPTPLEWPLVPTEWAGARGPRVARSKA